MALTRTLQVLLAPVLILLLVSLWSAGAWSAPTEPLKLLMVLWRGETAAERGFLDELQRRQIAVEITRINAFQDRNLLAAELRKLAPRINDFAAVYSFGTTASVMTKSIVRGRIPQLFSMVSTPEKAGLMAVTEGAALVTGSTDAISADLRISTARQLFPVRRVGILFNAREQNAIAQLQELERLKEQRQIELEIFRVAPSSPALATLLQRLGAGQIAIDTLYLPSDSYIISQSKVIMQALKQTRYRVVGATETFVRDGALLAVAPDYEAMGRALAGRLQQLLAGETDAARHLVVVDQPRILYNELTRQRLGIEIPPSLAASMVPIR